jgi:hypothetical protein
VTSVAFTGLLGYAFGSGLPSPSGGTGFRTAPGFEFGEISHPSAASFNLFPKLRL